MLVWGAWREAFARAVADHRAAQGRLESLTAPAATAAAAPPAAAALAPDRRHQEAILAAAQAARAAAAQLPTGWASAPWPQLDAAQPVVLPGGSLPGGSIPGGSIPGGSPGATTGAVPGGRAGGASAPVRIGTVHAAPGVPVPLHVPLLGHGHLTIDAPVRDPRVAALLQGVLLRLVAGSPPGSVRVLAHDPAGLGQVFAPFEPLVGAGLLVEVGTDRTGLMAALDTADEQVRAARQAASGGARASLPALVVVIGGLQASRSPDVEARLAALAHAGPAAGVCLVLAEWPPPRPAGHPPAPALENATGLRARGGAWSPSLPGVGDDLDLPVELDPPPPPGLAGRVCGLVARAAEQGARPTFDELRPTKVWSERSATGLATPVGRDASGRPYVLRFDDTTPHWLVAGRSGAGKTVFLLDVLAGLALRYPPSELAIHLLDFKEGVSFTEFTPTPHDPSWLPHAVAVGVESDREYGVAVLRALTNEMSRRATLFKRAGVTSLAALRAADPAAAVPRVLALIDEFQVLFAGNDDTARTAADLLEDVARKGRSFGVHLVLASQTAAGIEALQTKLESIFGQFPLRVALAGGSSILDPLNPAADGLPVGAAIVNASGGIAGANVLVRPPLPEAAALAGLRRDLCERWHRLAPGAEPPSVFEGFAEHLVTDDPTFEALAPGGFRTRLLVGRAVDVGSPTAWVPLDAAPGRHLAVVGPSTVGADVLHAALLGLGRQHHPGTGPGSARFVIAPLVHAGDAAAHAATAALTAAGHDVSTVPLPQLTSVLAGLARFEACTPERPTYLVLFGAEAAGPVLSAVSTETFRPGTDDLRAVVQSGPVHGVHVLGWWRSLARLGTDVGPTAREDFACLLALNVPGEELSGFLGRYDLHHEPRPGRALLLDRHDDLARLVIPFTRGADDPVDVRPPLDVRAAVSVVPEATSKVASEVASKEGT